ncbi:hypothetical protein LXA43DRAFT_840440, partial [Ganoderma leucocontextum]
MGRIPSPALQWGAVRQGRRHSCRYCGVLLLTGEDSGFCCGPGGNRLHAVPALSPLPPEIEALTHDPRISAFSNIINLIISFASLESTGDFAKFDGPPGSFALGGRVYHCLRPEHPDSAIHWMLYDGFDLQRPPHRRYACGLPPNWLDSVKCALLRVNPFARQLSMLGQLDPATCPHFSIILADTPDSPEIAAIIRYSNTSQAEVRPRNMVISRTNNVNSSVPVVSR